MEEVQAYMQETELSRRVQQWEARIRPTLTVEEQYPVFDIHSYGARVISEVQSQGTGDHGGVQFCDLTRNRKHYEVSRMFAATLQLVGCSCVATCFSS